MLRLTVHAVRCAPGAGRAVGVALQAGAGGRRNEEPVPAGVSAGVVVREVQLRVWASQAVRRFDRAGLAAVVAFEAEVALNEVATLTGLADSGFELDRLQRRSGVAGYAVCRAQSAVLAVCVAGFHLVCRRVEESVGLVVEQAEAACFLENEPGLASHTA